MYLVLVVRGDLDQAVAVFQVFKFSILCFYHPFLLVDMVLSQVPCLHKLSDVLRLVLCVLDFLYFIDFNDFSGFPYA
jgi:hypothetical protein